MERWQKKTRRLLYICCTCSRCGVVFLSSSTSILGNGQDVLGLTSTLILLCLSWKKCSLWLLIHSQSGYDVPSATSQSIQQLRATFATEGLSEILVLANGTSLAFTSAEFQEFVRHVDGTYHIISAPFSPCSLKWFSRKSCADLQAKVEKEHFS